MIKTPLEMIKSRPAANIYLLIAFLITIFAIIYQKFLFDGALYLFSDIGSDTLNSYWPLYYYYTGALNNHGAILWSDTFGLGTNIFSVSNLLFDPFNIIIYAAGQENTAAALIYAAMAKTLFAGLFFYLYLLEARVSRYTAMLTAIIFAFNGYMVLWGQHYFFATAIALSSCLMYGVERWIQRRKPLVFIISTSIFCAVTVYFFWMISIYLVIYVPIRYWTAKRLAPKEVLSATLKSALYYFMGIGLSAALLFPRLYTLMTSYRSASFSEKITLAKIFQLDTLEYYIDTILRIFSNDITGTAANFFGSLNYYELPIIYCGTLTTILLPLFFIFKKKDNKLPYLIFFGIMSIFFVFPISSALMHGFGKFSYNYRWTFIFILFKLFFAAITLDYIMQSAKKFRWHLLAATVFSSILLAGSIYLGKTQLNWTTADLDFATRGASGVLIWLWLYLPIIYLLATGKWQWAVKTALILLVGVELILYANPAVNQRDSISQTQLNKEFYNDGTHKLIQKLQEDDPSFYRIGKKYSSTYLNDSLVQGYKGLQTYNSVNTPSYLNFLKKMDIKPFHITRIRGANEVLPIETLLGMKYFISRDRYGAPRGYSYYNSTGNLHTFTNNFQLPIAFTYDQYLPKNTFLKLSPEQKYDMLLRAAIIDDHEIKINIPQFQGNAAKENLQLQTALHHKIYPDQGIRVIKDNYPVDYVIMAQSNSNLDFMIDNSAMKNNLILQMDITASRNFTLKAWWAYEGNACANCPNWKFFTVRQGKDTYELNLGHIGNVKGLRLSFLGQAGTVNLQNVQLLSRQLPDYETTVNLRKKDPVKIERAKNEYVRVKVDLPEDRILFFSIPYDKGWHATIDGVETPVQKINIGFCGIMVLGGKHDVVLKFTPPYLFFGVFVSLVFMVLTALLTTIQIRTQHNTGTKLNNFI